MDSDQNVKRKVRIVFLQVKLQQDRRRWPNYKWSKKKGNIDILKIKGGHQER